MAAFDAFILHNFTLFSGQENVIEWLDATEEKFYHFKMSRKLRFIAIPLLIEGDAKTEYIRHRNQIKSFDDFYEFLLINYDTTELNIQHTAPNLSKKRIIFLLTVNIE
jgi:hypothetical protein